LNGGNKVHVAALERELDSSESDSERDDIDDDQETVPMEIQVAEFRKTMQDAMELFEDQVAKGNEKFVERFIASHQASRTLVDEVKHRRNIRRMPRTWGKWRHPATMYFK
jgi:hypothetical protein